MKILDNPIGWLCNFGYNRPDFYRGSATGISRNESKLDSTVRDKEVYIPGFDMSEKIVKLTEGMEVECVNTYALI